MSSELRECEAEIVERRSCVRMDIAEEALADAKRLGKEGDGFGGASRHPQRCAKTVVGVRDVGMLGPERRAVAS